MSQLCWRLADQVSIINFSVEVTPESVEVKPYSNLVGEHIAELRQVSSMHVRTKFQAKLAK